jgi:hypothetical protein
MWSARRWLVTVATQEGARVRFACSGCEFVIRVPTSHTGRKGKCPRCKGVVRVPGVRPCKPDNDETEAVDMKSAWIAAEAIESRSSGRTAAGSSGSGSSRKGTASTPSTPSTPKVNEADLALALARARVIERADVAAATSAADASVMIGLGTMVVAALWFFGGLAVNVVFMYAPVMFAGGAIALAKGLIAPPRASATA